MMRKIKHVVKFTYPEQEIEDEVHARVKFKMMALKLKAEDTKTEGTTE